MKHYITTLELVVRAGIPVNTIYDIGANSGDWAKELHFRVPQAKLFLMEANEVHAPSLALVPNSQSVIAVLSSPSKTHVGWYQINGTGDSYYRENTRFYNDVAPVIRKTTTVDDIVKTHGWPLPDFIKIDTQGSELDILSGAKLALDSAILIMLECPILCYNQNSPTISDYIAFMSQHGFTPVALCDDMYSNGRLIQVDIMFMKESLASHLNGPAPGFLLSQNAF